MYRQCKIQYKSGSFEVGWIPEQFAHNGQKIILGKNKKTGNLATIVEAYVSRLSAEMVEINRTYPLFRVTDI